ncbi:hypothetical protein ACTXT7_010409, partial [Hymenolepis weldensis]
MTESNETRKYLIRKPEIDRSIEDNPDVAASDTADVADRDINLLGPDWTDIFSVLEQKIPRATCKQVKIKEVAEQFATVFEHTLGKSTRTTTRLILELEGNGVLRPKRPMHISAMRIVEEELHTRLPFGIETTPAIFQYIVDNMIPELVGAAAYMDDIIEVEDSEENFKAATKNSNKSDSSGKAIAYISRTLTSAEKNHEKIEEEALANIYAAIYTPCGSEAVVVSIWLKKRKLNVLLRLSATVGTHVTG